MKKTLLNTKNEKIEKIDKNDLIEFINKYFIDDFTNEFDNDLNKYDYDTIDMLYCTIKRINEIVAKFNYYNTFYLYLYDDDYYIILINNCNVTIYNTCYDDFYNINECDFDFYDESSMYEYITNQLNEQNAINEIKTTTNEN